MSEIIVEILEGILGQPRKHYKDKSQISFDCPVCSYDIKGLEKGDGKGNLEINYESNVYKYRFVYVIKLYLKVGR